MERKPNKRVDDLINVLLTYEEDSYWRHKREKIYATKRQSANNNSRHTKGMTIVDEDLTVVNETTWKVKSQSKGKNMNIFDCFWLHFIITIVIIIIIIIIVIIITVIVIIVNPSIVLVNDILQRYTYMKTFSHQNFAQSQQKYRVVLCTDFWLLNIESSFNSCASGKLSTQQTIYLYRKYS